jgi:hypothetical protein
MLDKGSNPLHPPTSGTQIPKNPTILPKNPKNLSP